MINLKVVYQGKDFELNLPTMFSEIDINYLSSLVANVNVAPNYSLIAILFKEKPYAIVSGIKQGKNATVMATPIMIKNGDSNVEFIKNIKLGDRLTISPSDIVYGNQVNAKWNSLNPNLLVDLLEDNKQLYKETQGIMQKVYFVDFKIVPSNVIHAAINNTSAKVVDCYFKESKNKD